MVDLDGISELHRIPLHYTRFTIRSTFRSIVNYINYYFIFQFDNMVNIERLSGLYQLLFHYSWTIWSSVGLLNYIDYFFIIPGQYGQHLGV